MARRASRLSNVVEGMDVVEVKVARRSKEAHPLWCVRLICAHAKERDKMIISGESPSGYVIVAVGCVFYDLGETDF